MVNTNKLKGRMAELNITQAKIANHLEIAQSTVNQKINNIRPFSLNQVEKLADLLKIELNEYKIYFFVH